MKIRIHSAKWPTFDKSRTMRIIRITWGLPRPFVRLPTWLLVTHANNCRFAGPRQSDRTPL
jgi:hypothetical protein